MDNEALKDEILNRMDMGSLSLTSMDLIDIINMFDISEEEAVFAYNQVVQEQIGEMNNTGDYIMDFFKEKGTHYPTFHQFKTEFEKDHNVSDKIIRKMHKQQIEDENQMSLFEMVRKELSSIIEEDDFKRAASKITKQWGGHEDDDERLSPEDLFGDESMQAMSDIADEYGEEDIAPFGSTEDAGDFVSDLTSEDVEVTPPGMIKVMDAEGNQIKRNALVKPVNGIEKIGRVTGFGDDGKGSMIILVDWQWPVNMKHTNPEEMGKEKLKPEEVVVKSSKIKEELKNETMEGTEGQARKDAEVYNAIMDFHNAGGSKEDVLQHVNSIFNDLEESGRGLGKGVKNSGDRQVKQREDNHSAPLTNLNESVDAKINKLFEGSVKKRDLLKFIEEEGKNLAKNIKIESK